MCDECNKIAERIDGLIIALGGLRAHLERHTRNHDRDSQQALEYRKAMQHAKDLFGYVVEQCVTDGKIVRGVCAVEADDILSFGSMTKDGITVSIIPKVTVEYSE